MRLRLRVRHGARRRLLVIVRSGAASRRQARVQCIVFCVLLVLFGCFVFAACALIVGLFLFLGFLFL